MARFDLSTILSVRHQMVLRCCLLLLAAIGSDRVAAQEPVKLAVFKFELEDFSAAGHDGPPDARDAEYLAQATEEATRLLSQSGRYTIIDTASVEDTAVKTATLHACNGCVGRITTKLGADQAVVGTITRISRTEYTLLMEFYEAGSSEPVARYFTGLRMGADYSWARGARSLIKNRVLAKGGP